MVIDKHRKENKRILDDACKQSNTEIRKRLKRVSGEKVIAMTVCIAYVIAIVPLMMLIMPGFSLNNFGSTDDYGYSDVKGLESDEAIDAESVAHPGFEAHCADCGDDIDLIYAHIQSLIKENEELLNWSMERHEIEKKEVTEISFSDLSDLLPYFYADIFYDEPEEDEPVVFSIAGLRNTDDSEKGSGDRMPEADGFGKSIDDSGTLLNSLNSLDSEGSDGSDASDESDDSVGSVIGEVDPEALGDSDDDFGDDSNIDDADSDADSEDEDDVVDGYTLTILIDGRNGMVIGGQSGQTLQTELMKSQRNYEIPGISEGELLIFVASPESEKHFVHWAAFLTEDYDKRLTLAVHPDEPPATIRSFIMPGADAILVVMFSNEEYDESMRYRADFNKYGNYIIVRDTVS